MIVCHRNAAWPPPNTPPPGGGGGLGGGGALALAISRGKFARQSIAGQEGNQGPYRLQGAEGERFIIVLAGTEKVYVDGVLLERGLTGDYVIDYNLGEVTFTPRQLITKDRRIIVEFEYAVQAFLRSTMEARVDWRQKRSRVYMNVYSEQDSKNSGGGQDLRPEDRRRLAEDELAEEAPTGRGLHDGLSFAAFP